MRTFLAIIGLVLGMTAQSAFAEEIDALNWQPEAADEIYVDVTANIGYILHENGDYISFPVATGLQKEIYWIGKKYFAATPVDSWVIQARDIQTDRVMFGKTGRFFRLYVDGGKTSYGIHGYAYFQQWLKEEDRYKSYGCIVVSEEILNIIDATYMKAGKTISVTTMNGSEQFFDKISEMQSESPLWDLHLAW